MRHAALILALFGIFLASDARAYPSVQLIVSTETAPPGGMAQFKVSLASPATISSGTIVMDFDASAFGAIAGATVFSASGDQWGLATVQGLHLNAQFNSPSGGIGRLPGLPILTVQAAVLPGAGIGGVYAVTINPTQSSFKDLTGAQLSYSIIPGALHAGGNLSIQGVTPGGGILPLGTVVKVTGTGFSARSTVALDVSLSAEHFAGPQEIDLTLGGSTEMTGKHVSVENADGLRADYFSSLPIESSVNSFASAVYPIFPSATYMGGGLSVSYYPASGFAIQNQNLTPVDITFTQTRDFPMEQTIQQGNANILPGGYYLSSQFSGFEYSNSEVLIVSSAPVRMLGLTSAPLTPELITPQDPATPITTSGPVAFSWQAGTAVPPPQQLSVYSSVATSFTVRSSVASGGNWLQVSSTQGTAPTSLTVAIDPTGLAPGAYQGTITLNPVGTYVAATKVNVSLQVTAQPFLNVTPTSSRCCSEQPSGPGQFSLFLGASFGQTVSMQLNVATNGNPARFSTAATVAGGGDWLTIAPSQGVTPSTVTITVNAANISGNQSGQIVIAGPANSVVFPVIAQISGGPAALAAFPSSVFFTVQSGTPAPPSQDVTWNTSIVTAPVSLAVSTQSGGDWLSATLNHGPGVPTFSVSVTPAGLLPGTYKGNVTLSASGAAPAQVPVTLTVWSTAPPLVVTPSSLVFTLPSDQTYSGDQTLSLTSGGVPLPVTVTTTTDDGGDWLFANTSGYLQFMPVTPAALSVNAGNTSGMLPATYHGSLTLTAASGSVVVPVTLVVTAGPYTSPTIGSIVNAASGIQGALSPGEIVTIHGIGMGELGRSLALDSNGTVATELSGAQVLFDGVPAPLLYASVSQLNLIAPYQIANQSVTNVQVEYNGLRSPGWGVPVLRSTPAIFTFDGTGVGPAAVLNQDNSMNSALNPAVRRSVIQIFGTGEGITNPAGVTGSITGTVTQKPVLPVSVSIGGVNATVLYAGSAPEAVAGLLQVNAIVPLGVTPGFAVPIVLTVGSASSPSGATIAVQ